MSGKKILVVATAMGFFGKLREPGGPAFDIGSEEAFAPNWMEKVGPGTPQPEPEVDNTGPLEYSIKHVPAGNWVVLDKDGNRASRVFKKDEGNAKDLALQEANRLNVGGDRLLEGPTGGGAPVATQAQAEDGDDPTLPDA